jgi:hypothetical protein
MNFARKLGFLTLLSVTFGVGMAYCPYRYDENGDRYWVEDSTSSKSSSVFSRLEQQKLIRKEAAAYAQKLKAAEAVFNAISVDGDKKTALSSLVSAAAADRAYADALAVAISQIADQGSITQEDRDRVQSYKNWCRESEAALSSYDSMGNEMLRVFVGPQSNAYAASWYGKLGYAFLVPLLNAWGRAFDKELETSATSFMKRASRMARTFFAQAGFISPLSAEQVDSWIRSVERYRSSMEKLSSSSSQDSSFANTFAQRNANRPEKGLLGLKEQAKDTVVDLGVVDKDLALSNPVKAYAIRDIPPYVTITESTIMLLRSQIAEMLQLIDVSYNSQRSLLNESLKMLEEANLMVQASFYEHHDMILTQKIKNNLMAQCDTIISFLTSLYDLLNLNKDSSSGSTQSSSTGRASKNQRLIGD